MIWLQICYDGKFIVTGGTEGWHKDSHRWYYRKASNISRTLVGNKIVDNSDIHVVGASPVGAAPTTSSFST